MNNSLYYNGVYSEKEDGIFQLISLFAKTTRRYYIACLNVQIRDSKPKCTKLISPLWLYSACNVTVSLWNTTCI